MTTPDHNIPASTHDHGVDVSDPPFLLPAGSLVGQLVRINISALWNRLEEDKSNGHSVDIGWLIAPFSNVQDRGTGWRVEFDYRAEGAALVHVSGKTNAGELMRATIDADFIL